MAVIEDLSAFFAHRDDTTRDDHTQYLKSSTAAGDGLIIAGRVLAVNPDGSTLETNADALRVKDGGITQAKAATGFRFAAASTAAPASPARGDLWLDTDANNFDAQVYYGATTGWQKPWNMPWGNVGFATKSTDQAAIGAVADISGLSVTWTAVAARLYKISYSVTYLKNTSAGLTRTQVTNSTNGIIRLHLLYASLSATYYTHTGFVLLSVSAGSTTYKLRAVSDSNTMDMAGSADPGVIVIEDIGPNGNAPSS